MKSLLLMATALALSTAPAMADSANSDWNDSAGFASSAEMLVLMQRFKLRQQIPTGFANITNLSVGTWNQIEADGEADIDITTTNDGSTVTADQDTGWSEVYK